MNPIIATACACAAVSAATGVTPPDTSAYIDVPTSALVRGAGDLDEDFETGFSYDPIDGQNGWNFLSVPTLPAEVASVINSSEASFGSASLEIQAPGIAATIIAFMPVAAQPVNQAAVDCLHDVPGLATYRISFNDSATNLVVTRLFIGGDGVTALQVDPLDPSQSLMAPTTGTVTPGVVSRFGVALSPDLRDITVFQDGAAIFTGHNAAAELFDLGESATPPSGIDLINLANFQTDPGAGGDVIFDNFALWITCPEDLNNDGTIDTADLGLLIGQFGTAGPEADLNGDGVVDTADLGLLIGQFGATCP